MTLFDSPLPRHMDVPLGEFAGRARHSDPETSKAAAALVDAVGVEAAVLAEFKRFGWLTDDELADAVTATTKYPAHSVKTARSRLTNRGLLEATGEKRLSNCNRPMGVYRAVHENGGVE